MSALDDLIEEVAHQDGCSRAYGQKYRCKCRMDERRTEASAELAALRAENEKLRARGGDLELILRYQFDADKNAECPWDWFYLKDGTIQIQCAGSHFNLRVVDGLPILTDEARAALRGGEEEKKNG